MERRMLILAGLIFSLASMGVAHAQSKAPAYGETYVPGGIINTAATMGEFHTFLALANAAGFDDLLLGEGYFTVFAPTDEAFKSLPAGTVDRWLNPANREELWSIVASYIVPTKVIRSDIGEDYPLVSLSGRALVLRKAFSQETGKQLPFTVSGARVVTPQIDTANGAIFGINKVLTS